MIPERMPCGETARDGSSSSVDHRCKSHGISVHAGSAADALSHMLSLCPSMQVLDQAQGVPRLLCAGGGELSKGSQRAWQGPVSDNHCRQFTTGKGCLPSSHAGPSHIPTTFMTLPAETWLTIYITIHLKLLFVLTPSPFHAAGFWLPVAKWHPHRELV